MSELAQQLENGDVDIYIGVSAGAHDGWVRRKLLDDTFATAQRKGHPRGTGALDLESYCALSHLVVSSAGDPFTGFVDQTLAGLGYQRHVAMSTQSYAVAPALVAGTDLVCTLPERMLKQFASTLDLFAPPLPLQPITIYMYWHPKTARSGECLAARAAAAGRRASGLIEGNQEFLSTSERIIRWQTSVSSLSRSRSRMST